MKRFSFLYADKDAAALRLSQNAPIDDKNSYDFGNILKDLNLEGISAYTGMDKKDIDYVLGIISDFGASADDVKLRIEILSDFLNEYGAFDSIDRQVGRFQGISAALLHAKKNMNRVHATLASDSKSSLNYNRLVLACEFLSKTYLVIFKIYSDLKFLKLKSARLNSFFTFIEDIVSDGAFKKLHEECEIFLEHLNEGVVFDADIKMNELLRIISVKVTDFRYVKPVKQGFFYNIMRALSLEENKSKNRLIYIQKTFSQTSSIAPSDDIYLKSLIQNEINLTAKRLSAVYESLIDLFMDISQELVFYSYALKTIEYIRKIGGIYCLPKVIRGGRHIKFKDLYDLSLAGLTGAENGKVVKNDFEIDENGIINIVTGANQSGKTTFLRSFGTSLLFARAGLPVPAYEAEVNHFGKVYTHFQRYDAELLNHGQLDTELAEMERIVYAVSADDIILMNESFSSTGYKDALRLSCDVLSAFSKLRARTVFITHINDLGEKLQSEKNLADKSQIQLYRTLQAPDGSPTYLIAR